MSAEKLFQPIQVGDILLQHRIVHAPTTRFRANDAFVHQPLAVEYYSQRATVPGTLLIAEGTAISQDAGGFRNVPGIYTDEQIAVWKQVTDAVHAKGSFIFLQIVALGRAAGIGPFGSPVKEVVSASDIILPNTPGAVVPRALTIPEIHAYAEEFGRAASNAVNEAGFDGVEIHGANGFLVDQFLKTTGNRRTDEYGGSEENRSRFVLEVIDAIAKVVGPQKTAIRFSPWSYEQDSRMKDPVPTYTYLISQIRDRHPDLAYIHVVEARDDQGEQLVSIKESNDFIRKIWSPRPLITAGGYTRESAITTAERNEGELIAFGRPFIANPDLPLRLRKSIPLTIGDRSKYYVPGSTDPVGYTDYPFATPIMVQG